MQPDRQHKGSTPWQAVAHRAKKEKGGKEVESVEIVELIKITFKRGKGTEDDPVRVVTQYWDKENVLICEKD